MPIPAPRCPKCKSKRVKPIMMWRMPSGNGSVLIPPQPMFACQEPVCLHQWARPSDAEDCEHTIQRLIDLSFEDNRPMGRYVCVACGTEIIRPYKD